ncbi:MAG: hypothetical protein ACRYE7_01025, partial [Janthinobacterium lividum]
MNIPQCIQLPVVLSIVVGIIVIFTVLMMIALKFESNRNYGIVVIPDSYDTSKPLDVEMDDDQQSQVTQTRNVEANDETKQFIGEEDTDDQNTRPERSQYKTVDAVLDKKKTTESAAVTHSVMLTIPETLHQIIYENDKPFDEFIPTKDRLNLQRARRYISEYTKLPNTLDNYKIQKLETDLDTGIFNSWSKNSDDLSKICHVMLDGVRFLHTQKLKSNHEFSNDVTRIKAYVDDFINRLLIRFEKIDKGDKIPWGKNWYVFSVVLVSFLAQYLLLENSINREKISTIILKIIPDPMHSFKMERKQYSSQMLGPWLLANYFKNTLDVAVKNEWYLLARKNVIATVKYKTRDYGVHLDMSWLAYTPAMPAYGSLIESIDEKSVYYYYLDESLREKRTLKDLWPIMNKIICHPTIPLGNIGMFGRRTTNNSYVARDAPLGIRVQPFSRYIRFNTVDRQFNVRAQAVHLAYYQMDSEVMNLARYWVQYRVVHTSESKEEKLKYPMPGIIHSVGEQPDPQILQIKETATFIGILPKTASSFVMQYKHLGFMYQTYEISEFENYIATELIVMNSETNTIHLQIDITNRDSFLDLEYVMPDRSKIKILRNTRKNIVVVYNLYGETVCSETSSTINLPIRYGDNISIQKLNDGSVFVMFVNNVPVIASFDKVNDEPLSRVLQMNNLNVTFTFNTNT